MTRLATALFAVLVVATFAAFFVAQRLKNSPTLLQEFRADPVLSPNQDGRKDRARVRFLLKRADTVTIAVVDRDGDEVRELLSTETPAYREVRATWDGRDDDGERVADGIYRYRITLQEQGRSLIFPRAVRLDTRPPRPRVLSIGPIGSPVPRPELLPVPGGGEATIRLYAPGGRLKVSIHKLAPGRPRTVVERLRVSDGDDEGPLGRAPGRRPRRFAGHVRRRCRDARRRGQHRPLARAERRRRARSRLRRAPPRQGRHHRPLPRCRAAGHADADRRAGDLRRRRARQALPVAHPPCRRRARGAAQLPHARRSAARACAGHDLGRLPVRRDHRRSAHDGAVRGPGRAYRATCSSCCPS